MKLFAGQEEIAIRIYREIKNNQKLLSLVGPIPLVLKNLAADFIESHISTQTELNFKYNLLKLLRIDIATLLDNKFSPKDFEANFFYILIIKNQKTLYKRTIEAYRQTKPQLIGNFIIAINEFIGEILLSEGSLRRIDHDAGTILVHKASNDLFYVGIALSDNIKTRVVLKEFATITSKYFTGIDNFELLDPSLERILNKELDNLLIA